MNDGQISVTLQLLIADAIKQAKAARTAMQKEFGIKQPDGSKAVTDTNKAGDAQEKLGEKTRRTNRALSEQQQRLRDIASGKYLKTPFGANITDNSGNTQSTTSGPGAVIPGGNTGAGLAGSTKLPQQQNPFVANPMNNMLRRQLLAGSTKLPQQQNPFVANPMNNMLRRQLLLQPQFPTAPKLPGPAPVQPNMFKQIAPMLAAALGTGIGGPLGGAIAGVLTKLNPAVAATTAAVTMLRYAVQETAAAYERARNIYAKSVQSGFGIGQQVQRGMLASVIGVSENDIYQYGAAILKLNGDLDVAIRTIKETNSTLTLTGWKFKVLEENLKAVWAAVAEATAPAVNALLDLASAMAKLTVLSGVATVIGGIIGTLIEWFTRLAAILLLFPATVMLIDTAIIDGLKNITAGIQNYLAGTKLGKLLGIDKTEAPGYKNTKDATSAIGVLLKTIVGVRKPDGAGNPQAFMKQMPVSAWERLGLNIGGGGGQNFQQQTANNTKKLTAQMEKLHNAVVGGKGNFSIPKGMPAGA